MPETPGCLRSSDRGQSSRLTVLVTTCPKLQGDLRSARETCLNVSCVVCILSHVLNSGQSVSHRTPWGMGLGDAEALAVRPSLGLAAPCVDSGPTTLTTPACGWYAESRAPAWRLGNQNLHLNKVPE